MIRNPSTWGLKIPGRPPTPSEGYAQQYDRIGPVATQKTWTFDNGTCLTYGPDDLVDEFDPVLHPFCNQIALIDTLIRDNIAVRSRYEASRGPQTGRASPHSDMTAVDEDPFNSFRQNHLDPHTLPQVKLASGIYLQVPSRYASIISMPSVYATPNKSDTPGEEHRGLTNDTRFGVTGKFPGTLPGMQDGQRDNKPRARHTQHTISGVRQGRGGRHLGPQQLARIPQQFHNQYKSRGNYPPPPELGENTRMMRGGGQHMTREATLGMRGGHQHMRGRGSGGGTRGRHRKSSVHRHERFHSQASQAFSVSNTPFANFAFPIINNINKKFTLQDYEDEGPTMGTIARGYGRRRFPDDEVPTIGTSARNHGRRRYPVNGEDEDSYVDQMDEHVLGGLRLNDENIAAGGMMGYGQGTQADSKEALGTRSRSFQDIPISRPKSRETHAPMFSSEGPIYHGSSNLLVQRFEGFPPTLPAFSFDQASGHMIFGKTTYAEEQDDSQTVPSSEYAKFLDELNKESRAKGHAILAGDQLNDEHAFVTKPSIDCSQGFDSPREMGDRGSPSNNNNRFKTALIDSIRVRKFRPGLIGSSTRPSSPTIDEQGRLSEPPRDRPSRMSTPSVFGVQPVLFEESKVFSEDGGGNLSANSSSIGPGSRTRKRRLFE